MRSKNFIEPCREHCRNYNNAVAFASTGLKEVFPEKSRGNQSFVPNVRIHGKVYHSIDPLYPADGEKKTFAQIYIHDGDGEEEAERRMEVQRQYGHSKGSNHLQKSTMKTLQDMLHRTNPFVKTFKKICELDEKTIMDKKLVLTADAKPRNAHKRKYNLPEVEEVALLDMSDTLHPLDVVINLKQGGRQFITESHRHFDSLHYVLLFPHGDEGLGWHWEMKQNETSTKNMSAAMYYSYLFQFRR